MSLACWSIQLVTTTDFFWNNSSQVIAILRNHDNASSWKKEKRNRRDRSLDWQIVQAVHARTTSMFVGNKHRNYQGNNGRVFARLQSSKARWNAIANHHATSVCISQKYTTLANWQIIHQSIVQAICVIEMFASFHSLCNLFSKMYFQLSDNGCSGKKNMTQKSL